MRTKRVILYAAVAGVFLAAGCGQTHIEKKREEARQRWGESRAKMMVKLAEGCFKRGDLVRARKHVEDILNANIPYAPGYALAARLAAEMKELDKAHDYAETAKAIDPESAEARYVLGTIEQTLGHETKALVEFTKAVELNGDVAGYALAEAEMLVAADQAQAAAGRLAEAAERMPGRADVHAALGDVLSLLGRHQEAAGAYRIALQVDPEQPRSRERLATALFYSGAYDEAEPILAELAKSEPDFAAAWIHQMRADCLLVLGRTDEARTLYEAQARRASATSRPLVALAKCDIFQNRLPSAGKFLDAALASHPQDTEANALMGYILVAQGRPGEAVSHLKLALKDPKCDGRETVEWLLARAEGKPLPPPPKAQAQPSAARPQDTRQNDGLYVLARPANSS